MGEHAPYAGLRKEVRSSAARLAVARSLGLRPGARVAELFAARDALLGHEALEHELACRDHRPGVLFRRQSDLIHQIEQPRHDAESLETRFRALVAGDLERPALDTTFSRTLIGRRGDTPERRSTRLSSRASNATRSISSAMKGGSLTGRPSRSSQASCRVIAVPRSTVWGYWVTT